MKKLLSLLLSICLLFSLMAVPAMAEDIDSITAYFSLSIYGEIADDKNGNSLALTPVTLTGIGATTLDDILTAVHETYFSGGSDGYATDIGQWGPYISKFWGIENGFFGYYINGISAFGPSDLIENGDFVDFCIYKNAYPYTEAYAAFDTHRTETYVYKDITLTLTESGYDENGNMVTFPSVDTQIFIDDATSTVTDADGKVTLSFDTAGTYIVSAYKTKTITIGENELTVPAITAPVCAVTVKELPDASITVPSDVTLSVSQKDYSGYNYRPFTALESAVIRTDDVAGTATHYFEIENGKTCNIRINGENIVTYVDTFTKTENFTLSVTAETLAAAGTNKKAIDRNAASNDGYNVADILLNINEKGYLKLDNIGDTYRIINLRNWEAVNSTTGNYFIEPDYHYTVIDESGNASESVVTISDGGLITAVGEGSAIVLVTYDAMNAPYAIGGPFFGAIWPENTGVFVVSVGAGESGIISNMTVPETYTNDVATGAWGDGRESRLCGYALDAEHDVVYFTSESGSYTFTPQTENCSVFVANPNIDAQMTFSGFVPVNKNSDSSFSVPLTAGRNIIKLEADGKAEYQVITAKRVNITINNGETVHPGDSVNVVFDTLYHPANKLAGIYNMTAKMQYKNPAGETVNGGSNQYKFASTSAAQTISFTVPEDYNKDVYLLNGGSLQAATFGDPFGSHRTITPEAGKDPNFTAASRNANMGFLPDIAIPVVATDSPLSSVTLTADGVKTEYYSGYSFDTTNLVVTANYEDGTTQIASNYTVSPEILTEDTQAVTISYRGQSADIPVSVVPLAITAIEVSVPPSKATYTEGEYFDPTGMVVSAVYNSGKTEELNDYTYSPTTALTTEVTEITVTYGDFTASVPISVSAASSPGNNTNRITVYFTLYGDTHHGADETHTYKDGNLDLWIRQTKITVPRGSYVIDALTKALSSAGIPYSNPTGSYVESIRGLSEFDNGDLSGWMYKLNGKHPSLGVDEQILKNGDKLIFHYTDDYTVEQEEFYPTSRPSSKPKEEPKEEPVTPTPKFTENTFADVKTDDWYYPAVKYVYENSLMEGTGESFEPEAEMTRAMLVTVLYRFENPTENNGTHSFEDVPENEWYSNAVKWAAASGIVNGISEGIFAPDMPVSREQIALILYRYAKNKNPDISGKNISGFDDTNEISIWAKDAVCWAVSCGLMKGTSETILSPSSSSNRAQVATFLMRFCDLLNNGPTPFAEANGVFANTAAYLINTVTNPNPGSVGGEWTIIGLARSGEYVPHEYFEKYYSNLCKYVSECGGILHNRKYTEYSRTVIALTATDKNPADVAGYDLVSPLLDYDKVILQGINGPIWALIALDCGNYFPESIIRKQYIDFILSREISGGGWALSSASSEADADITAMVLTALSNYRYNAEVSAAIERGIEILSKMQNDNGGYTSYNAENSESSAQVLTAISALGISYKDERFVKNGFTLVDNILSFYNKNGFSHTTESNLMATEQCFYALAAAKRFISGKSPLFDMK